MTEKTSFTIAELADEFGITARAIRFYEDSGLITPTRRGTARIYSSADRARLAWILRGKRVGFSLKEIGELLDLYERGEGREKQIRATLEKCEERLETLEQQKRDIADTMNELEEFCDTIRETLGETSPSRENTAPEKRSAAHANL